MYLYFMPAKGCYGKMQPAEVYIPKEGDYKLPLMPFEDQEDNEAIVVVFSISKIKEWEWFYE